MPELISWEEYPDDRPHYESILIAHIPWQLLEDKLDIPTWVCHSQAVTVKRFVAYIELEQLEIDDRELSCHQSVRFNI